MLIKLKSLYNIKKNYGGEEKYARTLILSKKLRPSHRLYIKKNCL